MGCNGDLCLLMHPIIDDTVRQVYYKLWYMVFCMLLVLMIQQQSDIFIYGYNDHILCCIWFKYDLGQKYFTPQVRPEQCSNSWPPDHDSIFHVTETPALTTWPPLTSHFHSQLCKGMLLHLVSVAKEILTFYTIGLRFNCDKSLWCTWITEILILH